MQGLVSVAGQPHVLLPDGRLRSISSRVLVGHANLPVMTEEESLPLLEEEVNTLSWTEGDILTCENGVPEFVKPAVIQALRDLRVTVPVKDNPLLFAACGATFHHDAEYFGDKVLVTAWLEGVHDWDLLFPELNLRIELTHGTVVVFDPGRVHGVVKRGESHFEEQPFHEDGFELFAHFHLDQSPEVQTLMGFETFSPDASEALRPSMLSLEVCLSTGAVKVQQR